LKICYIYFEIVTNGGIVGTVKSVDESFATVEIASGVVVKVQNSKQMGLH
jgi:preprotein translocase subunit YajC